MAGVELGRERSKRPANTRAAVQPHLARGGDHLSIDADRCEAVLNGDWRPRQSVDVVLLRIEAARAVTQTGHAA